MYEEPIEMSRNDSFTRANLVDYLYQQNYYKLIGIDLLRQTNMDISQNISLAWKLE